MQWLLTKNNQNFCHKDLGKISSQSSKQSETIPSKHAREPIKEKLLAKNHSTDKTKQPKNLQNLVHKNSQKTRLQVLPCFLIHQPMSHQLLCMKQRPLNFPTESHHPQITNMHLISTGWHETILKANRTTKQIIFACRHQGHFSFMSNLNLHVSYQDLN